MILSSNVNELDATGAKVVAFLHDVWVAQREGRLETLVPDPFYERATLLTPEIVSKVCKDMDDYLQSEITNFPGYHNPAQGIQPNEKLVIPGYASMPDQVKRYIVFGVDRILQADYGHLNRAS